MICQTSDTALHKDVRQSFIEKQEALMLHKTYGQRGGGVVDWWVKGTDALVPVW